MRVALYPLLFILGVLVYVRFLERATVFQPTKVVLSTPKDVGIDYEDVFFPSLDKSRLHGWFVPAAARPGEAPVVLFLHGNAGNVGDRLEKILMFH
nr:alpha/beta hydrolase [Candidatus Omnitrophota bacterium]